VITLGIQCIMVLPPFLNDCMKISTNSLIPKPEKKQKNSITKLHQLSMSV